MHAQIVDVSQVIDLWTKTYNTQGKPDWSHILPYYADDVYFRDSIQEIHGIEAFTEMTERLANRSQELEMNVLRGTMDGNIIFIEWEMSIAYKKRPRSILYGASRLLLNEREPDALGHRFRQLLAVQLIQLRLGIEQIDVARRSFRQEKDAVLGFRGEVRRFGPQGIGRSVGAGNARGGAL